MPVLGLTGGFASGKSTVASFFKSKGAVVLDADAIARELVVAGSPALAEIRARFGESVVTSDGLLDRAALGKLVFSNPAARSDLNAILHPKIFAELRSRIAAGDAAALFVVEAALLVESAPWKSGELNLDALVAVDSSPDLQVSRAVGRGVTIEDARRRIAAQTSRRERLSAADYVLKNRGTIDDLEAEFEIMWSELQNRFGMGGPLPGSSAD